MSFDDYAERYEAVLNQALAASGESADYFARGRVAWLRSELARRGQEAKRILDFGCGVGLATPLLLEALKADEVFGVDVSEASMAIARSRVVSDRIRFASPVELKTVGPFDVAYCNGVLHHVPRAEQLAVISEVHGTLRPGGILAVFENNPWNPGARYCMRVNPWDRGATMISASRMRRLLTQSGLQILTTNFLFYFPRWLSVFRPLELALRHIPFGAQYVVLAQKAFADLSLRL